MSEYINSASFDISKAMKELNQLTPEMNEIISLQ